MKAKAAVAWEAGKPLSIEEIDVQGPKAGEVLVRVRYISLDPAMRGWTNGGRSYVQGVKPGDVMMAVAVGLLLQPRCATLTEAEIEALSGRVVQAAAKLGAVLRA